MKKKIKQKEAKQKKGGLTQLGPNVCGGKGGSLNPPDDLNSNPTTITCSDGSVEQIEIKDGVAVPAE